MGHPRDRAIQESAGGAAVAAGGARADGWRRRSRCAWRRDAPACAGRAAPDDGPSADARQRAQGHRSAVADARGGDEAGADDLTRRGRRAAGGTDRDLGAAARAGTRHAAQATRPGACPGLGPRLAPAVRAIRRASGRGGLDRAGAPRHAEIRARTGDQGTVSGCRGQHRRRYRQCRIAVALFGVSARRARHRAASGRGQSSAPRRSRLPARGRANAPLPGAAFGRPAFRAARAGRRSRGTHGAADGLPDRRADRDPVRKKARRCATRPAARCWNS